ncbi:MAG: beta-lactamase family protein [Acidobacteriota bacterium]|nr:beta-lactamase family protein [Acidobacteriota bacterium]
MIRAAPFTKIVTSILLAALVCLLPAPHAASADEDPTAALAGLWGFERTLGPEVSGELTITRRGAAWRARVAGSEAPVRSDRDELSFTLPNDRGQFRGRLSKDAGRIVGHWIQPPTVTGGTRYATPLELVAAGDKVWRGQVAPLTDRVELYLSVSRQGDGTYSAFLRDPLQNVGAFLRLGSIRLEGDSVRLASRGGEIAGKYDSRGDTLSLALPSFPAALDFRRRGREQAEGFYPRTPALDAYVYRRPRAEADGWQTAALADVGLDPKSLTALVERILKTGTDSVHTPYIQGLLVARHGRLALEEYFYGFDENRLHDTRSAGKSLTTTLVGIAIDRGAGFDTRTPVPPLFPAYKTFANDDARKRRVTVGHLLSMSSGLACDDENDDSPGNENTMQSQAAQPDWYKYALDLPMAHEPGERAAYCSAGINLLGGVIENTTHEWLPRFLYENFARPLDIRTYHMNLTPTGDGYGAGGIYLRPRDFIKLGQLFLDGGRWRGRQVVSRKWVEQATAPHASIHGANDYGYGWWLDEYSVGSKTYYGFHAAGNGGQLLVVIPELDLVVALTAGNYGDFRVWSKFGSELVPQFIIPAAIRSGRERAVRSWPLEEDERVDE